MKVGDLVQHKRYGFGVGIVTHIEPVQAEYRSAGLWVHALFGTGDQRFMIYSQGKTHIVTCIKEDLEVISESR